MGRDAPASQNKMDERPSRSSIAVHERMDRFELGMDERRLRKREYPFFVAEGGKVA